ncbi:MAG: type III-B CRISPR module RAMP protein Cmr4 [Candidatus Bathyarchaeota archaeon]|jgi:CRISPR-associated protein Cmr4|nr:type III-B CRISPR module RAMP protein Cmr4 [Candidatus Bathyarchaeota archaeon]
MFERTLVMYIYAETPIHPGSGTTISGTVDLPIQRERHTEFPIIQGSSLKGVLRNGAKAVTINEKYIDKIFGEPDRIGGVTITDARTLAFPVRTLKGVFGWITCPLVLERYKRDLLLAGAKADWETPKPSEDSKVIALSNSNLKANEYIYVEDLQLGVEDAEDESLEKLIEDILKGIPDSAEYKELRDKFKKDLIVMSDDVFRDLTLLTTEAATRIRIGETGTVVHGGLWSEEYLPSDTLLYSLILIPSRLEDLKPEDAKNELIKYNEKILQIGGDETIGKGFARLKVVSKEGR